MQGLPETTPVCGHGVVGAGVVEMVVGKTWWRKERKMIWEQQIISLSLKVFNILDPDNYKGLTSGLTQSAGSVAFSRCSYCAKTCSESKFKMEWGGGGKKRKRLPANAMILSISPLFLRAPLSLLFFALGPTFSTISRGIRIYFYFIYFYSWYNYAKSCKPTRFDS